MSLLNQQLQHGRFFKHKTPLSSLLRDTAHGWQAIPAVLELAKTDALPGGDPTAANLLKR